MSAAAWAGPGASGNLKFGWMAGWFGSGDGSGAGALGLLVGLLVVSVGIDGLCTVDRVPCTVYEYSEAELEKLARTVNPDLCCVVPAQGVHGNVAIGYWYWYYTSHLGFDLALLALLAMRLLLRTVYNVQAAIAIAIARSVLGGASGRDLGLRVL